MFTKNIDRGLYTFCYKDNDLVKIVIADKTCENQDTFDYVEDIIKQMEKEDAKVIIPLHIKLCKFLDKYYLFEKLKNNLVN